MNLLIACGNSLRQDDGAGLLLAQRLAEVWQAEGVPFRYLPVQQLLPELAVEIADEVVQEVWFVDTRVAMDEKDRAVQIRPLSVDEQSPTLGHQLSPEMLLLYARLLFDKRPLTDQPSAWQMTIPGFEFGHAERLSEACQAVLDEAMGQVMALMGEAVYA
jgi:hydrogenase maturation protease